MLRVASHSLGLTVLNVVHAYCTYIAPQSFVAPGNIVDVPVGKGIFGRFLD